MSKAIRQLVFAIAIALTPGLALANTDTHSIVRVDEDVAYIDMGRKDGLEVGATLEVLAAGPYGQAMIVGSITVDWVGPGTAMGKVPAEIRDRIRAGTMVRIPPPPAPVVPVATVAAEVEEPPAPRAIEQRGPVTRLEHTAPNLVPPGVPLTLTAFAPEPLMRPVLMYRTRGAKEYKALPFTAKPDSYFTARVDADEVQAPGFEYYIVVDEPSAPRSLAIADPEQPSFIGVEGRFNQTEELARYGVADEASTLAELVSYRSRDGVNDYYTRIQGEYLHRIFKGVYSMRFGGGWLRGHSIDRDNSGVLKGREVGFLYAYTEAEFRSASVPFAFLPRMIFGVNDNGVGGGVQARIRVGDELGMNFEAGVTVVSEIGFETFTTLTVNPTRRLTLALSAHLEDLPLADELGFRSHVDARLKIMPRLWGTLRLGVAARSIDTIGPDTGLGFAVGF